MLGSDALLGEVTDSPTHAACTRGWAQLNDFAGGEVMADSSAMGGPAVIGDGMPWRSEHQRCQQ